MRNVRTLVLIFAYAVLISVVANATQPGSKSASESSDAFTQVMGGESRNNGQTATSARRKAQTRKQTAAKTQTQPNATAKGQSHSSASVSSPNPAGRALNEREPVSPGDSAKLGQESQSRGVSPAKGATIPTATVSNPLPAPAPSVASPAAIASSIPRHRDPNPPAINGLSNSKTHNSATINGTAMHRKP